MIWTGCANILNSPTPPGPGRGRAAWWRGSRQRGGAWMSATWSPTSRIVRRTGSTPASIAPEAIGPQADPPEGSDSEAVARREPDQAAQGPTGLGSHQLPLTAGQPDAPHSAYRRLLADAPDRARHPQAAAPGACRVHHHPRLPAEGRAAGPRERQPRASRLRGKLARGGVVPRPVAGFAAASNLNAGAAAPTDLQPAQPATPDRSGSTRRAASRGQLQSV